MTTTATFQLRADNLQWTTKRGPSGRLVAWCDALGLTVEADNEGELHDLIAESHHALFWDLLRHGELAQFLLDRGWALNVPVPTTLPEGAVFDVPYNTVAERAQHAVA